MLATPFDCSEKTNFDEIPENVTFLRLRKCGLENVDFVTKFESLIGLDLSENPCLLDVTPLAFLQNLRYLVMNSNSLTHLSLIKNIATLQQIQVLKLANNKLTQFPAELLALKNLQIVDLSYNPVSFTREDLEECPSLRLKLYGISSSLFIERQVRFVNEYYATLISQQNNTLTLSTIINLDQITEIKGTDFKDFKPEQLQKLTNLEVVDLSNCNDLGDLYQLGKLKNLKVLKLNYCKLNNKQLDVILK